MIEPVAGSARLGPGPRVIDLVFALPRPERRGRALLACTIALLAHASLVLTLHATERSLEEWSATLAARVHASLAREELVELHEPEPVPPAHMEPPTPLPAPAAPSLRSTKVAATKPLATPQPAAAAQPSAQAAAIMAPSQQPVDLTGDVFVTGSAEAYAGGATSGYGTNTRAVPSAHVASSTAPAAAVGGPNLSQPVGLEAERWNCPWPKEADAENIAEQTAVLQVWVQADGAVESARVLSDPGHGFGAAALTCAEQTRFNPARDRTGRAVRAQSPPIRVRFIR